ncbi:M20/M25/M40 family metallo-hydrolase [Lentisphaerota bacterium ZTH]|nr:M20/M25/M40 family metallo-hydrolase [Lentisphaerota bacterium]WET06006.1 M20/M25/M40 family metallo-hydrolase [Lentisphaerota bacterium ZTH]
MNHSAKDFIKILSDLLEIPAPAGYEQAICQKIADFVRNAGFNSEIDPAGNLLVRINGRNPDGPVTVLAAHMDEIGMVVTDIESDGNLKVINSGGLVTSKIGERPLEIISDKGTNVTGIFSMGSAHHKAACEGEWHPGWNEVRIITGLSPAQLEARGIRVGSPAVPVKADRGPYLFGDDADPMLAAWTFDDRAGVAIMIQALKQLKDSDFQPENPLIIAFTVHEEGGCHGAKALADREHPWRFIAVDGCPVLQPSQTLDGRPGCWSKDKFTNYDRELLELFADAARAVNTGLQYMVYPSAGSDASAVYNAGNADRAGFIGHVRINSHGFETARLSVFSNALKVILEFINKNC